MEEIQNNTDTTLPTISSDMKDVFEDTRLRPTNGANVLINGNAADGNGGIPPLNLPSEHDVIFEGLSDFDVESLLSSVLGGLSSFSVVPSKKERGKPYFSDDKERILTTKRNEPVLLQLDTCKPGQKILLTLRYSDLDYYDQAMTCTVCSHAYKGCQSSEDHSGANFCVRSRDGKVEYMKLKDGNSHHPTAVITVATKHEQVELLAAFKCRNSCPEHKKYGGDRTLRLVLLDEQGQNELCRNEWSLRVCESAKRDHNLFLSKAGTCRPGSSTSAVAAPPTPSVASLPPQAAQHAASPLCATEVIIQPPPLKRIKVEEETIIHYIDDNGASSTIHQVPSGRPMFRYVTSPSPVYIKNNGGNYHNKNGTTVSTDTSNGGGSVRRGFDAKPLLPIAPPASGVSEAPAPTGVVPVMVYPKTEADKKLLTSLAERLGMNVYNVVQ